MLSEFTIDDVFKQALPQWFVEFDRSRNRVTLILRHGTRTYESSAVFNLKTLNKEKVTSDDIALDEIFEKLYIKVMQRFIDEVKETKFAPKISQLIRDSL